MSILNRREFSGLCVAFGSFTAASALDLAASTASTTAGRTVKFRTGTIVPALGQGSANLGKGRRPQVDEEETVRTGLSLGMTLIDTAEIYGSEEFIGRAIAGLRDSRFPGFQGLTRSCGGKRRSLGVRNERSMLGSFSWDLNKLFDVEIARSSWTQVQLRQTRGAVRILAVTKAKKRLNDRHL